MFPLEERITVFAGSEGECEEIFLKHLRSMYSRGLAMVKVKNAGGKHPLYIVEKSIDQRMIGIYDHSLILMDTDKPYTEAEALARKNGFELFLNTPCFEAFLLETLNLPIPTTSRECKEQFQHRFNGDSSVLQSSTCEKHFTNKVIEAARKRMPKSLDRLIKRLQGLFD
jgi:hypothetical protein